MSQLDGQLAVVTGGASGIGAGAARLLAERGADVVVTDIDEGGAAKVAADIGGNSAVVDVCDRQAVSDLFSGLSRAPSILVTSAGGAPRRDAIDVDEQLFADTYQLNVGGFWRCAQEAARRAIADEQPLAIVHIASSTYRGPAAELSHFSAAKAASVAMMRCLAHEWAGHRVRVNAVIPGAVETATTAPIWDARPGIRDEIAARLPLGRIGEPADIASAVGWLASEESAWVTGTVVVVDGGGDVA